MATAGIKTEMGFANEIREELLEHARVHNDAWNDRTKVYAAPMQELAFDERGLASLPKIEVLEAGLPCSGASKAGRSKRGLAHAEAHPEVGHLVVSALVIIGKTNPAIVILENVPEYAVSASADILRNQMRDLGYETHERVLSGKQWGTLENRNRWCMVAVTQGIKFDFEQLMPPAAKERRLGDVLEPLAPDDSRWSRMEGLKAKEERDAAAGKGFAMQVFTADDTRIGTITKGYAKVRSTDPKIAHPTDPDLLRQITPIEHARVKEVPEHLVDGLSATMAHEVLGQGIVYPPFHDVGHHVGNALNRLAGRPEVEAQERALPADTVADVRLVGADLVPTNVAEMASEILMSLRLADPAKGGEYRGRVVVVDDGIVIQDVGLRNGIVHKAADLAKTAPLGAIVTVKYEHGRGRVAETRETAQMALQL